jgi:serine/threonine protein kinase
VSCIDEDRLLAFVGGHLGQDDERDVRSHVTGCSECRAVAAAGVLDERATPPGSMEDVGALPKGFLLGRYVVLELLGAGGMGVVYAAYDPALHRTIAVKLLRPQRQTAAELLRFEARALARLSHPNVVAIHDTGEVAGHVFIAMERIEGLTLREWLDTSPPAREVLTILLQAGAGLAAAHDSGIVHRDFKPSNVLVRSDGRAVVSDFGLARVADSAFEGAGGTLRYMSPEQRSGASVDSRSDQYSFCLVLQEALRDAPLLAKLRRALGRGLSARSEDRYPSMSELLTELRLAARPARWPYGAAAATLALLVAGGAFAARERQRRSCLEAAAGVDELWSTARRHQIQAAFVATRAPFAKEAFAATSAGVQRFADRWRALQVSACVAARVHGRELHPSYEIQRRCLGQRLAEAQALVHLLTEATAGDVADAISSVDALEQPEGCAHPSTASIWATPPTPEQVPLVQGLTRARSLAASGRNAELLEKTRAMVVEGQRLRAASNVMAMIWYEHGRALERTAAPFDVLDEALHRGLAEAQRSGSDVLAAAFLNALVRARLRHGFDDAARRLSVVADATCQRVGAPASVELERLENAAVLAEHEGRPEDAARHRGEARALRVTAFGADAPHAEASAQRPSQR